MWRVYQTKEVNDPKYGRRTIEIPVYEGSKEHCEAYVSSHPNTYVAWYCF